MNKVIVFLILFEGGLRLENKRQITIALLVSIIFVLIFPYKSFATSWAYPFVVWNDYIYVISDEYIVSIDRKIGEVTKYSDMEQYGGDFSNVYPKGTKYYSIEGTDTAIAIAVQDEQGNYIKAIRDGEYTYQENFTQYSYRGLGNIAILLVGFIIYFQTRKNS